LENSIFHRLSNILWAVIVTAMVLLAIYVSVGRLLVSNLGAYQSAILQELNHRIPFTIEAQRVHGEWHSFTPMIVLDDLRLSVQGSGEPPLVLSEGRVGIDVLNSLRTRSLQLTRVALDDLSLRGELTAEGKLKIKGFDGGAEIVDWLHEFLLNVERVALRDNQLQLTLPGGESRNMVLDVLLTREGSFRRVEASLVSERGTDISILAEGVGDPFQPQLFTGDLYLDIQSTDLGAVKDMLANGPPPVWAEGTLNLELWLSWDEGEPALEASLEARDLLLTDQQQSWQVPLDRVALQARLLDRKNRWTLFGSGLELDAAGASVRLPRVQLDAWGDALRVRAEDVSLAPLSSLVAGLEATPDKVAALLGSLEPRGDLTSLQLSLGNIDDPVADWELEANFEDIAVQSIKGAPGVNSADGYVQLAPGGGFFVLDSPQLSLDFPTLYREPLHYDDFYGNIDIAWDAQHLTLSSGLVSAQGREGSARVLFGLDIPLVPSEIGIEMDLLVGLQNSHPIHRAKYVPYVLNQTLRDWLNRSIGEGTIEQGAFLWRGGVQRKGVPYRTIQLAFNIRDTELNYHPQWPAVTIEEGVILIDDTDVSVWADRGRLFDSRVENISVETWLNEARQIMLAVDGSVAGPAADGLSVLNQSPLNKIVGGAFTDWTLRGELQTELELQMNLGSPATPPQVQVATRWQDVAIDIMPGKLPLRGVSGEFEYSTARGFSSRNLAGTLWEQPFKALVQQRPATEQDVAGAQGALLEVAVDTRADMNEVRQWLGLPQVAFARGESSATVTVLIAPQRPPLLRVESFLAGTSLDLPDPWRKSADEERRLWLEMPLATGSTELSLALGEDLRFDLDVTGGELRAGALAIGQEPATLEPGVLRITGKAPLVEADQWIRFVEEYITGTPGSGDDAPVEVKQAAAPSAPADGAPGVATEEVLQPEPDDEELVIIVDQVQADELVLWGRQLQDVLFNLTFRRAAWLVDFDTSWLRGELYLARDESMSRLDIDHLDLAGLPELGLELELEQGAGSSELELPDMDVALSGLVKGEHELGALAFELRSQGDILAAWNITGELEGMKLPPEHAGQLLWRQGEGSETKLQARLQFEDLGETLERFGYQKIVETQGGKFDLELSWPGPPQDFSLAQGQGSLRIAIDEGSFLEAPSGATGALRVVSILNLADIVRRLSLSHMFESGIPFDSVDGEVYLHQQQDKAVIEVARMDVQGGSSFHFSGVSDLASKSLQGELVATLPVANNLAWVAALTASLPVAAGVFLVSKVFQKQVNRLSSAVYSISGSWDDPQVEFDHIFDASSDRKQGAPAADDDSVEFPAVPAGAASLPLGLDSQSMMAPDPQAPLIAPDPQALQPLSSP
jgi:uncharacterized protein (TIGR02099 family)